MTSTAQTPDLLAAIVAATRRMIDVRAGREPVRGTAKIIRSRWVTSAGGGFVIRRKGNGVERGLSADRARGIRRACDFCAVQPGDKSIVPIHGEAQQLIGIESV